MVLPLSFFWKGGINIFTIFDIAGWVVKAMNSLVSWVYEKVVQLLIFFMATMGDTFRPDPEAFTSSFSTFEGMSNIIVDIAFGFCVALFIWTLIKNIMGLVIDFYENPLQLVGRLAIAMTLIAFAPQIFSGAMKVADAVYDVIDESLTSSDGNGAGNTTDEIMLNYLNNNFSRAGACHVPVTSVTNVTALTVNDIEWVKPPLDKTEAQKFLNLAEIAHDSQSRSDEYYDRAVNILIQIPADASNKPPDTTCQKMWVESAAINDYHSIYYDRREQMESGEIDPTIVAMKSAMGDVNDLTSTELYNKALSLCSDDPFVKDGDSGAKILLSIALIFLWLMVLGNFVKLMLEVVERYVLTMVLFVFAPLGIATFVTKTTEEICKRYVEMFIVQLLILDLNLVFVKTAMWGVCQNNQFSINWIMMLLAFLICGQRLDEHITSLGGVAGKTGGALGATTYAAFRMATTAGYLVGRPAKRMATSGVKLAGRTIGSGARTLGTMRRAPITGEIPSMRKSAGGTVGNSFKAPLRLVDKDHQSITQKGARELYRYSESGGRTNTPQGAIADNAFMGMIKGTRYENMIGREGSGSAFEAVAGTATYNGNKASMRIRNTQSGEEFNMRVSSPSSHRDIVGNGTESMREGLTGEKHSMVVSAPQRHLDDINCRYNMNSFTDLNAARSHGVDISDVNRLVAGINSTKGSVNKVTVSQIMSAKQTNFDEKTNTAYYNTGSIDFSMKIAGNTNKAEFARPGSTNSGENTRQG